MKINISMDVSAYMMALSLIHADLNSPECPDDISGLRDRLTRRNLRKTRQIVRGELRDHGRNGMEGGIEWDAYAATDGQPAVLLEELEKAAELVVRRAFSITDSTPKHAA